jgi:multidrug resistance efflux pump
VTRCALVAAFALVACARPTDDDDVVVGRGDLVIAATATGELAALDTTDIAAPRLAEAWQFKIASLAAEGSAVAAGDQIVAFDSDELEHQLAAVRIDVAKARETLAKRRQEVVVTRGANAVEVLDAEAGARKAALERDTPPDLIGAITAREHELDDEIARMRLAEVRAGAANAQQSDAADLRALVDFAEASDRSVAEIEQAIAQLVITAPRAGVIVYNTASKVGTVVYRGQHCLAVVGTDHMVGHGTIDEVALPAVAIDQAVTLRLDAMPDLTLHGKVTEIGTSVEERSAADPTLVVPLTIAVDSVPGVTLRPGMRFRAGIEVARVADVVQIPAEAVFVTADGPVAYRDTGERVPLVLGHHASDAFEVVAGVAPGDRLARIVPEDAP